MSLIDYKCILDAFDKIDLKFHKYKIKEVKEYFLLLKRIEDNILENEKAHFERNKNGFFSYATEILEGAIIGSTYVPTFEEKKILDKFYLSRNRK